MSDKKILISFVFFVFMACTPQKKQENISGNVQNNVEKSIILKIDDKNDTISLDKNGNFACQIPISEPTFVRIIFPATQKNLLLLVDSLDLLHVNVDARNPDSSAHITGSKGSVLLQDLQKSYTQTLSVMQNLSHEFEKAIKKLPPDELKKIQDLFNDSVEHVLNKQRSYLKTFITNNKTSFASIPAIFQSFDMQTARPLLLDEPDGFNYFMMLDSLFREKYPNSKVVSDFHERVVATQMAIERVKSYESRKTKERPLLKIGDVAPLFSMQSVFGGTISLSQCKGKVVLLDFWASWAACQKSNFAIRQAYLKYHERGFEVFQVSLDTKKDDLMNAISHYQLPWKTQGCDYQMWSSGPAILYIVKALPTNFLIDKNGKIRAINLKDNQIMGEIEKLLR